MRGAIPPRKIRGSGAHTNPTGPPGPGKRKETRLVNKKKTAGRTLAVLGAAALGLTGLASVASAADLEPGNIVGTEKGSLTIYKYDGLPTGQANDGQELTTAPNLPTLEGVEFTIQELGLGDGSGCQAIDLTTNAGWDVVDQVNAGTLTFGDFCVVSTDDGKTDADGT